MNHLTIKARSIARKLKVTRLIHKIRSRRPYEDRFHTALQKAIRPGDIVWDVGANVGFYSELFLKWTGPTGRVVAFEPVPSTVTQMRERIPSSPCFSLEQIALGADEQDLQFITREYNASAHAVCAGETVSAEEWLVPVHLSTGDSVSARLGHVPNIIKIDVEGAEEEVLRGFAHTLTSPALRALFIEIHFHQLELRGEANAPVRIEKLLRSAGYRVTWTDASHLKAERPMARS